MKDNEVLFMIVAVVAMVFLIVLSVNNTATNRAVENCISANYDWRVDVANNYCNSVIKNGVRP